MFQEISKRFLKHFLQEVFLHDFFSFYARGECLPVLRVTYSSVTCFFKARREIPLVTEQKQDFRDFVT